MSEHISQTRIEDALAEATSFLGAERGVNLDGDFASSQLEQRVTSTSERAEILLQATPHPTLEGLYVPLHKKNAAAKYDEAVAALPGYMILIPSNLVETGTSVFYPAVVSEDGVKNQQLRLHVLKQPYRQYVSKHASVTLSAAGQAETTGIGEHGRTATEGIEAEHFTTLLTAGIDDNIRDAWQAGVHNNHVWRTNQSSSVTGEMSKRLFTENTPQTTITITRQDVEQGRATLLWHEGMRNQSNGKPENAARDKALVIVQGLGFQALKAQNPRGIDTVKRLLA
jgi:hypothetical protein